MGLDIRVPIGLLFVVLGSLLALFGLATLGDAMYVKHSLGYNVNLWWGLVMLVFGLFMCVTGWRPPAPPPST